MAIIVQMGSTLSRPLPLWTLKKGKHLLNMMQPVLWIKDGRRASFQVSGLLKCPSSPKPGYGPAFLLFPPAWKVTLTQRQVMVSSHQIQGPPGSLELSAIPWFCPVRRRGAWFRSLLDQRKRKFSFGWTEPGAMCSGKPHSYSDDGCVKTTCC